MSEVPETELPEPHNDPFRGRCAMLVSALAMVLAIAGLGGNNAAKESTLNNILAANAYAFYQAKNIRQTEYKIAADNLQLQLAQEKLTPKVKELAEKKLADYQKNIARYESEPETGDGKKELMADYPVEQLSIRMRERIVLPLVTIQQYAITRFRELGENKKDAALKESFGKLVMRCSFGIINAGRNSA